MRIFPILSSILLLPAFVNIAYGQDSSLSRAFGACVSPNLSDRAELIRRAGWKIDEDERKLKDVIIQYLSWKMRMEKTDQEYIEFIEKLSSGPLPERFISNISGKLYVSNDDKAFLVFGKHEDEDPSGNKLNKVTCIFGSTDIPIDLDHNIGRLLPIKEEEKFASHDSSGGFWSSVDASGYFAQTNFDEIYVKKPKINSPGKAGYLGFIYLTSEFLKK